MSIESKCVRQPDDKRGSRGVFQVAFRRPLFPVGKGFWRRKNYEIFSSLAACECYAQLCGIERIPERHRMSTLTAADLRVGRGRQGLFIQQITILTPSRYTILLNMDAQ